MTDRVLSQQEMAAGQKIRDELIRQGLVTPATENYDRAGAAFIAKANKRRFVQSVDVRERWR